MKKVPDTFNYAQHGLRRAVRRGLANVAIQAYLTAAVINLKRLVTFADGLYRDILGYLADILAVVADRISMKRFLGNANVKLLQPAMTGQAEIKASFFNSPTPLSLVFKVLYFIIL